MLAYDAGVVTLHSPIKVRLSREVDGETRYKLVETTVGRLIYNEAIPQDLGFVDRTNPETMFDPEIKLHRGQEAAGQDHRPLHRQARLHPVRHRAGRHQGHGLPLLHHRLPHRGHRGHDRPAQKYAMVAETEKEVAQIDRQYRRGLLTNDERYRLTVEAWDATTKKVEATLQASMDQYNPIFMMADSGARGSMKQINQLAGMRGLMADTSGRSIEIPIKANFREGLSVLEYFISSRGARKGMADTALRTADSGYLTRRLVDVSQEVIVREDDCGTTDGIEVQEIEGIETSPSASTAASLWRTLWTPRPVRFCSPRTPCSGRTTRRSWRPTASTRPRSAPSSPAGPAAACAPSATASTWPSRACGRRRGGGHHRRPVHR